MSLEAQMAELTEALKENSELLKVLTSSARKGLEDQGAKPSSRSRSTKKDEDDGGDEDKGRNTRSRSTKKDKAPTVAEVKKQTEAFLDVDDEKEYAARRKIVKGIVEKYDAPKMTEIAEEDRAAALADLAEALKEREDADGEGEDDDVV